MICQMSFDVRILYVHVNVTLTKFAIRLGPVSGGRSGNRCRLCIGKPLLMRKLEPRYDNPPLASSSLSILTKRFVLSIVKHCYICVIGFLLKILHYSTIPYLFSLLLLFAWSEERSISPCMTAKDHETMNTVAHCHYEEAEKPKHGCRDSGYSTAMWNRWTVRMALSRPHASAQYACLSANAHITRSKHYCAASSAVCG